MARADALERAFDEARGAAGAELLSGVDGVVGTLLDLVEVDAGVGGGLRGGRRRRGGRRGGLGQRAGQGCPVPSAPGGRHRRRPRPHRLDRRGAHRHCRRATAAGANHLDADDRAPGGTESIRRHVRPRSGGRDVPGLEAVLDTLLAGTACALGGWSDAIDLALARPDLVVVTRDGDRFSSTGWRVRAGGGAVTAAVVDEARSRAEMAAAAASQAAEERAGARSAVEATRTAASDAVRSDDRNEVAHQTARAARQRVADDRVALTAEVEEIRRACAELEDRIARDVARTVQLDAELPRLEADRIEAAGQVATAREERSRIDERMAEVTALRERVGGPVGRTGRTPSGADRAAPGGRATVDRARRRAPPGGRAAEAPRGRCHRRGAAVDGGPRSPGPAGRGSGRTARAPPSPAGGGAGRWGPAGGAATAAVGQRARAGGDPRAAPEGRAGPGGGDHPSGVGDRGPAPGCRRVVPTRRWRHRHRSWPRESDPPTRIVQLEAEIAALGPVNPLALEELAELSERHRFLETQVEDVRAARRELHHVIRTLDEEIMHVFDAAFADVNEHFSSLVTSLFPGGTGRLSLTDPENLLDTGVEIEVRPAGRNVRRLSLLSGGERSLVALAYLFAVFRSRPSPFYLMDEVEAALDDVNLQRFLGLVHEFRGEAQLIIVSHQKRTMEAADALYGVTMAPGGSSKVVSQRVPRRTVEEFGDVGDIGDIGDVEQVGDLEEVEVVEDRAGGFPTVVPSGPFGGSEQ